MLRVESPKAKRFTSKDAVFDFGQCEGDGRQLDSRDGTQKFIQVHSSVFDASQGDMQAEFGIDSASLSFEMTSQVVDHGQKHGWDSSGREMDDLGMAAACRKSIQFVERDRWRDGLFKPDVEAGQQIHIAWRVVDKCHGNMVIAFLPFDIDTVKQVPHFLKPGLFPSDGHLQFNVALHNDVIYLSFMIISVSGA